MTIETKFLALELLEGGDAFPKFKHWLTMCLHEQVVSVTFTKKDGTERVMRCTLGESSIPAKNLSTVVVEDAKPTDKPVTERKANPDIRTVYDVEAGAWRSFRWDSIKSVTYTVDK